MLRINRPLAKARLQCHAAPPSPWICRACLSSQSTKSKQRNPPQPVSMEDVEFPSVYKRKGKSLRMEDATSEQEKLLVHVKKEKEHNVFITRLEEYIATRKNMFTSKHGVYRRSGKSEYQEKRALDVLEHARKLRVTPVDWPALTKNKAIRSEDLEVLHMAATKNFPKKKPYKAGRYDIEYEKGSRVKALAEFKLWEEHQKELRGEKGGEEIDEKEGLAEVGEKEEKGGMMEPREKVGREAKGKRKGKAEREEVVGLGKRGNGGKPAASKKDGGKSKVAVEEEDGNGEQNEPPNDEPGPADAPSRPPRKNPKEKRLEVEAVTINSKDTSLEPVDLEQDVELRPLMHGLDRVLFNPGVTFLRDPRSRVYNFDPYLGSIMPVDEFDFDALGDYITSSKDTTLIDLARTTGKKYVGSTSSMTSILSHLHYLLSRWRPLNLGMLSKGFETESSNFTRLSRLPVSVILQWRDGVYAIDQDKESDNLETILLFLGRSMEKMLTLPPEVFQKYHKSSSHEIPEEVKNARERYHYTGFGDLLFRSQLDAHDDRLPGTGVFDLKTRGVLSVRMNAHEPAVGWGYQIKTSDGQFESFEREYYDLIRSAFMKYSLQVRMGRMDGCFVAYHNTKRIFGFQYISIDEMDAALHGGAGIGEEEFKLSLKLLNEALDRATTKYPEQSLRLWFETRESGMPFLYFAAEPLTPEQVAAARERTASLDVVLEQIKRSSERMTKPQWRQHVTGAEAEAEAEAAAEDADPTEAAMKELLEDDKAAEQLERDNLRESVEVLESITINEEPAIPPENRVLAESESGNGAETGADAPEGEAASGEAEEKKEEAPLRDVLVQVLVAQNLVNGVKVDRPTSFNPNQDSWQVNYAFLDMDLKAANRTVNMMRKRKEDGVDFEPNFRGAFIRHLATLSREGEEYAERERREDREGDVTVYARRG